MSARRVYGQPGTDAGMAVNGGVRDATNGDAVTELSDLFDRLAEKWRMETSHFSILSKKIMHESYQQIMALGPQVLPLLFHELRTMPDHWFWALQHITRENPTAPGDDFNTAVAKWIEWGRAHGY